MHVVRVRERRVVVVAREDVPNDAKEEERQHDDEWVRSALPREYLFNCPESLSRLCMETYSRPRRGLSAVFGFDDLNASLGGLCSLVLRLSVDGHEKCAIIWEERGWRRWLTGVTFCFFSKIVERRERAYAHVCTCVRAI